MARAKAKKAKAERKGDGRRGALEAALDAIKKRYGEGAAYALDGSAPDQAIEVISSGSPGLDRALGVGGFARGRIVEVFGPEASGKTTLALSAIAECQKAGGAAVMIDVEHALDRDYAKRLGVRIDTAENPLVVSQPDNGEQALEILETLVNSSAVDLVVLDSVAALVPRAELEGDMIDVSVAGIARLMSKGLRKLAGCISRTKTCVIFINQIRMRVGMAYGNPETTTGGRALKFYASQRVDVRVRGKIQETGGAGEVRGNKVEFKVVKNKVAPPFRTAKSAIIFEVGIDWPGELIDMAEATGAVERKGPWYEICVDTDPDSGKPVTVDRYRSKDAFRAAIRKKSNLADWLRARI